jgi:hypothetical protein
VNWWTPDNFQNLAVDLDMIGRRRKMSDLYPLKSFFVIARKPDCREAPKQVVLN